MNMAVYTKISPVYQQGLKAWAQVDGSVSDLSTRSSAAALAAGATADNLAHPEIVHNIIASTSHTVALRGPSYADLFPKKAQAIDRNRVDRGYQVYMAHCNACHGHPDRKTGAWVQGKRQGEVVPYQDIGTDPERVVFRHNERIADAIYRLFPKDHPFSFPREVLRTTGGYISGPIDSAFSRAPYLHNASILTLAELINLTPRRALFYRGRNLYDPQDLGYKSPESPTSSVYFPFDTSQRGNSNKGHDYPWPYQGTGWNEQNLIDLLEYLKTV
jgi:mono/diheme cytochrome c family protein